MAEVLSRFEIARWGKEAVAGTSPTDSFKRLLGLNIRLGVEATFDEFTPAGLAVPTIVTADQEWTKVSLDGRLSYVDVVYPLSAAYGPAAVSITAGGTSGRDHDWNLLPFFELVPQSFTWEQGQPEYAKKAVYGSLARFGFEWGRGPAMVSGDGIARPLQKGITVTGGSLLDVDASPVIGRQISVYLDDTAAALGTTLLTRVKSGSWEYGTGRTPAFYVNAAAVDWAHTVDGDTARAIKLVMMANSTGYAMLDNMRAGSTKFLRIQSTGSIFEGANAHMVRFDAAVKVVAAPSESDVDRIWANEWSLGIVYDATWAASAKIKIRNQVQVL